MQISSAILDTSNELIVQRCAGGVKLLKPDDSVRIDTTVKTIFNLPFNVYLLNSESIIQKVNEKNVVTLGGTSVKDTIGKTVFNFLDKKSACKVREHDKSVIQTRRMQIVNECGMNSHDEYINCLSIKMPWYNDNDNDIVGIFGCTIDLGKHRLAEALQSIIDVGLLNQTNNLKNNFNYHLNFSLNKIQLSQREKQCLYYVIRGKSSREIGIILGLSMRTIETFIDRIKIKLNVKNKSELIDKVIDLSD